MSILDTKIEFLKGVGPKRALLLNKELSIYTFMDLLTFFPFRYIDRSKFYFINEISSFEADIQIVGVIRKKEIIGVGKKKRLAVEFTDKTGSVILTFFKGISWLDKFIQIGKQYLVFGKPSKYGNTISIIHPEMDLIDKNKKLPSYKLHPVYHSTEKLNVVGLNSKGISKLVFQLLSSINKEIPESLSLSIIKKFKFLHRKDSFSSIHFPSDTNKLNSATYRFKFEELFYLQISLLKQKILRQKKSKSFIFNLVGDNFNTFYHKYLNFDLTTAQKRVIREIRKDVLTGFQMNRLLQGDVGSGKTIVAFMSMLLAYDNGFQSCLMAPTEVLANQHFNNIKEYAQQLNLQVVLLTGKIKPGIKQQILEDLNRGLVDIVIGTHALIQDNVDFFKLGLVIIDEQHKFGVAQRAKLWKKNSVFPHVLVMTATPIPRTLAMTAYGDLDVSIIDELPPGRQSVKTYHKYDKDIRQVYNFMFKELKRGKQVYIVYPLIEDSKVLDYKNLLDGYVNIKEIFQDHGFKISMIHGRLKQEEKEFQMKKFLKKETHIMVATTVIEVGVDVANANTIIIQSAQKFGLSQLHQLRGRVGRGKDQSYCFLVTSNKLTSDSKKRLKAMLDCSDGFQISEIDLKLRGPGDILGTRQSGLINLKLASLVKDYDILSLAREEAKFLLQQDFDLTHLDNIQIRKFFLNYHSAVLKWGSVS